MAADPPHGSETDPPEEPDLIDQIDEVFPGAWNDEEHLPGNSDDDQGGDPSAGTG